MNFMKLSDFLDYPDAMGPDVRICPEHGEYHSIKISFGLQGIHAECPKCFAGKMRAEGIKSSEKIRAELVENSMKIIAKDADIPLRFAGKNLENFIASTKRQEHVLGVATRYAECFHDALKTGRSMIFSGSPGTGKTHLAIGIALSVIRSGHTAKFISTINDIRRVRETFRKGSEETERQVIEAFSIPDLLVLDEVGQQYGTDGEKVTTFDLINARYEALKPTIVVSNLSIDGVRTHLGDRAFDRLREGGGVALAFDWESFRK